jgi:hypothetical protein
VTRYRDPVSLRRALEARLKLRAETSGVDLGRLRRGVVFDRLAARLAVSPGQPWILKGGAAMEFRLAQRARMTKDLDVVLKTEHGRAEDVRETLIDSLANDRDRDGFTFRVGSGAPLAADRAERPACSASSAWTSRCDRRSSPGPSRSRYPERWRSPTFRPDSSRRSIGVSTSPRSSTR